MLGYVCKDMSVPVASIICLGYRNVRHLDLTLRSIVENTLVPSELILVVDNPREDMWQFLARQTYTDIVLVNKHRVGVANAYNQAMQVARGEYITHVFDNYIFPKPSEIGGKCWLQQSIMCLNELTLCAVSVLNEDRIRVERDGGACDLKTVTVAGRKLDLVKLLSIPFTMKNDMWRRTGLLLNLSERNGYEFTWEFMRRVRERTSMPYAAFRDWSILHFHVFCPHCDAPVPVKVKGCPKCKTSLGRNFTAGKETKAGTLNSPDHGELDFVTPYERREWATV